MAVMIPANAEYFDKHSMEDLMFEALKKLPNDYYVVHSFKIYHSVNSEIDEHEMDFVIYNPSKGIMVLEAKAGRVHCDLEGRWFYQSGREMAHEGPFRQADHNRWELHDWIKDYSSAPSLSDKCYFCEGVWFPSLSDSDLDKQILPANIDKRMILTSGAMRDPLPYIERIFALNKGKFKCNLDKEDHQKMLERVICPRFDIVPTQATQNDINSVIFHRLLKEQSAILNFLGEQRTAIINGAAGTGKTLIALEKAKRHAAEGDKVLFLCFNRYLREHLEEVNKDPNITFYSIAEYACKVCRTQKANYAKLKEKLESQFELGTFPFDHVIIDEGQDFGFKEIEENQILETLKVIMESKEPHGTFYVFYDRLQFVQGESLPAFLQDADCKLTLYKNCRNTENIAKTSLKPIVERKVELIENAVKGDPAEIYFCDSEKDQIEALNMVLDGLKANGLTDIVILTCKTEENSILTDKTLKGKYKKHLFTTCKKFKGLEAEAIVVIDLDEQTFSSFDDKKNYYVGTSRARLKLSMITGMDNDQCSNILSNCFEAQKIRKPKPELASKLNALYKDYSKVQKRLEK